MSPSLETFAGIKTQAAQKNPLLKGERNTYFLNHWQIITKDQPWTTSTKQKGRKAKCLNVFESISKSKEILEER